MGINEVKNPFGNIGTVSAPASLRVAVLERVARSRRRALVIRFVLAAAAVVASAAALVASFLYVSRSLESSGFYSYARLALSEGFGIVGYYREFALSLAESAPVLATAAVLVAGLALGWSTTRLVRQSRSLVSFA